MIKIGDLNISKLCVGNSEVSKVYLGSDLVYSGGTPPVPPIDYSTMYLTFEILSDGEICWGANGYVIGYRINGGNWITITGVTEGIWISVLSGDTVEFRGNIVDFNNIAGFGYVNDWSSPQKTPTATFNVYGNIMSLIYGDNFVGQNEFPTSTSGLAYLFGCPSWTSDFNTALISAENLVLPATTLTNSCYNSMFCHCSSLTTAPELPATTLADNCYWNMFMGCSSLNYIKCLATDISANSCTYNWVTGVASSGTFVKNANMTSWATGDSGIPTGWTVQDA